MDIYIEYLPALAKSRFANDQRYRHLVLKSRSDPPEVKLTNSEIDVLYWAAQGKTSEETAMILGLTKHTLNTYRKRAIEKLNASNITHAIYLAQLYDLIV